MLLHELAHVARFDCLAQWAACAMRAVYWMHPGAWWLVSRLRLDREFACDDLVLAAGAPPVEYARHLLDIAYTFGGGRAPALAVRMARRSQLEGPAAGAARRHAHASRAVAAGTRGDDDRRLRGAAAAREHDLPGGPHRRRATAAMSSRATVSGEASPATCCRRPRTHVAAHVDGTRRRDAAARGARRRRAAVAVAAAQAAAVSRRGAGPGCYDRCRWLHLGGAARRRRRQRCSCRCARAGRSNGRSVPLAALEGLTSAQLASGRAGALRVASRRGHRLPSTAPRAMASPRACAASRRRRRSAPNSPSAASAASRPSDQLQLARHDVGLALRRRTPHAEVRHALGRRPREGRPARRACRVPARHGRARVCDRDAGAADHAARPRRHAGLRQGAGLVRLQQAAGRPAAARPRPRRHAPTTCRA